MSVLFESVMTGAEISVTTYLVCLAAALVCGVLAGIAAAYRSHVTKSFMVSLILLPVIVATVIIMVNGNVGTGVAVMGAFSLVRFRSVPGKAKDIVSIFLAMTAGLACASGMVGIAVLFTLFVAAVMMVLAHIPMGDEKTLRLNITVPESLNYTQALEEVLREYTRQYRLVKTKTTNMGSLYKLTYRVQMKDPDAVKTMIDALRCRNGNLEIMAMSAAEGSEEL